MDVGVAFQALEDRPAVHVGHRHIKGDDGGVQFLGAADSFFAAGGGFSVIALLHQEALEEVAGGGVVVDDQDGACGRGGSEARDSRGGLAGEADGEGGPFAGGAGGGDIATHHAAEAARQGQAQTCPAELAASSFVGLLERFEQLAQLIGRHADAGVGDAEDDLAGRPVLRGGQGDFAVLGELGRVGQKVHQALADLGEIGVERTDVVFDLDLQGVAVLFDLGPD